MAIVQSAIEFIRFVLFEPITTINYFLISTQYLVFSILAGFTALTAKKFYSDFKTKKMEKPEQGDFSLTQVLLAGPLEEMGFRGTMYMGASMLSLPTLPALYIANGIWAGYHLRSFSTFAYTFVLGLFLTKFWTLGFEGLWFVAIIMHSLHNLISYSVSQWAQGPDDPRYKEENVIEFDPS